MTTRKFTIDVIERFYTVKTIEIVSDTEMGLEEQAIELASSMNNSALYKEETEVDIYEEEVIDD